jgi:hypothetical protein
MPTITADLVDEHSYPLSDLTGPVGRSLVDRARRQLRDTGAAELPGFIRADRLEDLVADARSLVPRAHHSQGEGGAYLEPPEHGLPAAHPRRYRGRYSVGAVAYDVMPSPSLLRSLYEWDPLLALVAAILDRGPLHRYADPFGALNLAVMGEGDELQWHFDQTDFVVSLAVQSSDGGGEFEVAPRIRTAADEHEDRVAAVLGGERSRVETLEMTPGTLVVFEGRHSLHRVSPVTGGTPRLVGLLAYDTEPGRVGSELLHSVRYGRTRPFDEPPVTWPAS